MPSLILLLSLLLEEEAVVDEKAENLTASESLNFVGDVNKVAKLGTCPRFLESSKLNEIGDDDGVNCSKLKKLEGLFIVWLNIENYLYIISVSLRAISILFCKSIMLVISPKTCTPRIYSDLL